MMPARIRNLKKMLHYATLRPQRSCLLLKCCIEYSVPTTRIVPWVKQHARRVWSMKRGISLVRPWIDGE